MPTNDLAESVRRLAGAAGDMNRFYHFLHTYWRFGGKCADEKGHAKINQHTDKSDTLRADAEEIVCGLSI